MVDPRDILKFADEVARRFKPHKIILFGSYAYGTPTEDSDVDLLVVMPHRGESYLKAVKIAVAVERNFPCDLMVRSPAVLRQRILWNDFFLKEVTEKGIYLYDAADQRVGSQGRRRLLRRLHSYSIAQAHVV